MLLSNFRPNMATFIHASKEKLFGLGLCCRKERVNEKHLLPPSFHFVYFPSSWQATLQINEFCQALLSPKSALRFSVSLDSFHLILSRSKRWNFTNCCQTRDSFFLTNTFTSRDRTKLSYFVRVSAMVSEAKYFTALWTYFLCVYLISSSYLKC